MIGWWKRRKAARRQIEADALDLIDRFGGNAYEVARRAPEFRKGIADFDLPQRPEGHWDRVRSEIAKRTGRRNRVDTATRYLLD